MLWENENVYLYVELRRFAGGVYLEHSLGAVPAVMTLLMGFASNQARDNKGCCCGFEMLYVQACLCRTAFNEDVNTDDFSMEASWKQKQFCCRVNTHLAYFSSVRSLCLFTWLLRAECILPWMRAGRWVVLAGAQGWWPLSLCPPSPHTMRVGVVS